MAADPPDPGLLLTRGHTRSPQSEDHDAGIEAATRIVFGTPTRNGQRQLMGEAIAAYLAHMAPASDARHDDPAMPYPHGMPWFEDAKDEAARSPQGEVFMVKRQHLRPDQRGEPWNDWTRVVEARSPQGEDREERTSDA